MTRHGAMTALELDTWRRFLGLTEQELASELDVAQGTVARWLRGSQPIPGGIRAELREIAADVDHLALEALRAGVAAVTPGDPVTAAAAAAALGAVYLTAPHEDPTLTLMIVSTDE